MEVQVSKGREERKQWRWTHSLVLKTKDSTSYLVVVYVMLNGHRRGKREGGDEPVRINTKFISLECGISASRGGMGRTNLPRDTKFLDADGDRGNALFSVTGAEASRAFWSSFLRTLGHRSNG